jgi:low affinity Fe/Cu permease
VTAFAVAIGIVIVWVSTGPFFDYSDTWQLIINTGTTIVTFLMVFLIQNTQNRDSAAIQLKLDEVIRSTRGAHNAMLDLEELSTKDLDKICALYQQLAENARQDSKNGCEGYRHTGRRCAGKDRARSAHSLFLTGDKSLFAGPLNTLPNRSKREP